MNQFAANLQRLLERYNTQQKILIIAVVLGLVSSLIALLFWANRPDYALLYSNLESSSASAIVQDLRDNNVSYELSNGGKSIYVPKEHVSEMRLKYVQSDYLKDGIQGYELFESSNMGMTTFMQRLNMRRALEGELTRTISNLPEVSGARVHLVIPEDRLFEQDKKGSASVVLHLKPGVKLANKQISGVVALVANSVENLSAEDVVVLGSNGELYSKSQSNDMAGSAGGKWELQAAIEADYQRKITEIVEGVVGYRNSVVNVSIDLSFDQIERTIEEVDPDRVALLSEEVYSETAPGEAGGAKAEKVTSNYELTKKLERFVSNTGDVKRISVAVLVNGKMTDSNGDGEREYLERSADELEEIASLVRSSIGYSAERNDMVEVKNLPFENETHNTEQKLYAEMLQEERFETYILYAIAALGALLVFFLLRTLMKSGLNQFSLPAQQPVPALAGANQEATTSLPQGEKAQAALTEATPQFAGEEREKISEDIYINKLSEEAQARLKASDYMTREVFKFSEESPKDASRLLRSWLVAETKA